MPRICSACSSPNRAAIDQAVTRGESFRRIAPQYGLSDRALRRHAAEHVPTAIVKAHEAREVARADDLLGLLREALADARRLRDLAEDEKDYRGAIACVRTLLDVVEKMVALGEKLAQGEAARPPESKPTLSDNELAAAIESVLARAAAREEEPHVC